MKTRLFQCLVLITIWSGASISMGQESTSFGAKRCTPAPNLLGNWKKRVLGFGATDAAVREHVERQRSSIEQKPDVFTPLFCMGDADLKTKEEAILWKSSELMVLVDKSSRMQALVIPSKDTTFPTDASPDLLKKLADVAALTSDAFMWAIKKPCDPTFSQIHINPPSGLMISQLYVHVVPRLSMRSGGELSAFHARVSQYLAKHLGSGDPPNCP